MPKSSQALVHELCNERRFQKTINPVLNQVRNGIHDGLFTAHNGEPNWDIAHRILMPAFGPMPIAAMFPDMHDLATQLTLKLARLGSERFLAPDDFTRLTLDTLALCAMNFRFNSFYREDMHPFLRAMADFLVESGNRSRRPAFTDMFYRQANKKYWEDIEVMRKTAEDVLKERREHPTGRKDLLTAMLEGIDPKTGKKMTDASIIDNLVSSTIAFW
jgi:cytochrome P450 / NADPH-cytochrome P450 reductase